MSELSPGQVFAGYRLVRRLGAGAFGEVWEATAAEVGPVALKFIRLQAGEAARELRGVAAAAKIEHPHVLRVHRSWEEAGFLIVAMELAEKTLKERLGEAERQGQPGIPRDELLVYLKQAADGIGYLNEHNVLHHDIKPENLLLVGGRVKVADFGFARLVGHAISAFDGVMTLPRGTLPTRAHLAE